MRERRRLFTGVLRQIRKNHALEHATVAVMLERGVRSPLAGYSTAGGFLIFGSVSAGMLADAVAEAYARLSVGEGELAISPYCGTNLAAGALLAGLVASVIMARSDRRVRRATVTVAALLGAALLGRQVGTALQRRYTVLADMSGLEVLGLRRLWCGFGGYSLYRVGTAFRAGG